MKLTNRAIADFFVLLPLILVYVGTILLKVYPPGGRFIKLFVFFYMAAYVLIKRKVDKNLFIATLLFLPFLIWGIFHSFNLRAGIEDGLRYLFPVVVLFYGYAIRDRFPLLLKFLIVYLLINFIAQFFNYYYWMKGVRQWFYPETVNGDWYVNQVGGIMRATGLLVNFDLLAFLGLVSFILIYLYYNGKYKKWLLAIALFLMFASVSYKTLFTFIIVLFILFYKRMTRILLAMIVGALIATVFYPDKARNLVKGFYYRLDSYILMKTPTVRAETYLLMWKELGHGNLLGRGVGMFGGPASIKYNSPYYKEVNFKRYDTYWMKMTTVDTFPPHVFIELGLIGGLMFFLVLVSPLFRRKIPVSVILIYLSLFINMLFTFSLAAFEYLIMSLLLVYPLIEYHKRQRQNTVPQPADN